MNHSENIHAFMGGLFIGGGALLLLWANGKVAGISGILGHVFRFSKKEDVWRWAFLAGLIGGGYLMMTLGHAIFIPTPARSKAILIAAGLLVGFGTQLGSGCTSGHGVCGLGRRSGRSLVATVTFMFFGVLTVLGIRVLLGGSL